MIKLGNDLRLSLKDQQMNIHVHERMINELIRDAMNDDIIRDVEVLDEAIKIKLYIKEIRLEVYVILTRLYLDISYPNLVGNMKIEKVETVKKNIFLDIVLKGTSLLQWVASVFMKSWKVSVVDIMIEKEMIHFTSNNIASSDLEQLLADNKYTSTIKLEECVKVKLDSINSAEIVIAIYDDSNDEKTDWGNAEDIERNLAPLE